jgi:peptide/nickel transport system substrate-binding protein
VPYRFRFLACLLIAALAACSKVATTTANGTNSWTIPGVLRIGSLEEPDSLNLMFGHTLATGEVDCLLFSFILRTDANGNLFPDLATEVPTTHNGGISADGKTITVHLRHGVVWSDGAPLTAADWLFTYHAVMNPRNNTKTDYGWNEIASASAPDPYTLVIHLKRPTVAGMEILTMGGDAYPPLPAHLLAKLPDINHAPFNSMPVSSGPFVLKRWDRGNELVFAANPRYFRGPPGLKEIDWKIIPNPDTMLDELRSHEIDVYPDVNKNSIGELAGIPGIRVEHRLIAGWQHLGMNMRKPQLADVRVRRAIAMGIDWKRLLQTIYRGYGQLAVSDIFPQSWAAPALPPYRYDPAASRALLAAAGWRMGSDGVLHKGSLAMRLTITSTTDNQQNERAEVMMQSMLQPLGIALIVHNAPANLLFAQDGPLYGGTYDLEWSQAYNGADPDDSGSWNSQFIPPNGADTSWLDDPIVDATSSAAASTFDEAKRKALYQREAARIRELDPAVFAFWEEDYYAINTDVKNYEPAAFIADEWNAWQWRI